MNGANTEEGKIKAMGIDEKRDVSPIELVNESLEKKNEELTRKVQEINKEKQESQAQWQQEKEGYEANLAGLREELQKYKRKNKRKTKLIIVVTLMFIVSSLLCYCAVYAASDFEMLENKYSDVKSEYEILESKYSDINSEYEILKGEYTLMEEKYNRIEPAYKLYYDNAVILPLDGSNTYHRYGCKELNLSSYIIYNINLAKSKSGLKPCPICFETGEKTE